MEDTALAFDMTDEQRKERLTGYRGRVLKKHNDVMAGWMKEAQVKLIDLCRTRRRGGVTPRRPMSSFLPPSIACGRRASGSRPSPPSRRPAAWGKR